jgi:hypothetical protein
LKKLLWSFFIISFIFLVPAYSIKSVLDDIARDTYEKNLRKQRIENIEDQNYEDPPSYNQLKFRRCDSRLSNDCIFNNIDKVEQGIRFNLVTKYIT